MASTKDRVSSKPELSRRSFLGGAAVGSTAAWLGCTHPAEVQKSVPKATQKSVLPPNLFGPPTNIAQLSRNENPYGPSPRVYQAVNEATQSGAYYADPAYLQAMIAERHAIEPQQVTVSHGSGEALCAVALAWGQKGAIVGPDLFWDTTALYAVRQGVKLRRVPMTANLEVDLKALEATIDDSVALVHLCNPNNPTGQLIERKALRDFCRRVSAKTTILIDEAYNELTDDPDANTVMDLVREGANIIVARTFSKIYGMAGMRIGYLMSSQENVEIIRQHQMSWMSAPSIAAAVAAYNDQAFLTFSKDKILQARAMISDAVKKTGLKHLPSHTNFMYVDVGQDANIVRQKMESKGIMVRGVYRDYQHWSRVSMGRIEDVRRYAEALPQVVGA